MAIEIVVGGLDDVPESLKPFVTEKEGKYLLDESKVKTESDVQNVLQAKEHEKQARIELEKAFNPYKALNKTPDELAELLKTASNPVTGKELDVTKTAEYLSLKKQFDEMDGKFKPMLEEYQKAQAEKTDRMTWEAVEKAIESLDSKYDREAVRDWAKDAKSHFKLNAISELDDIDGKKAVEFIQSRAEKYKFLKDTTPSRLGVGRVNNPNAGRVNDSGNSVADALANAPVIDN